MIATFFGVLIACTILFFPVIWLDFYLNKNDDDSSVAQFQKFQDAFLKGDE